MVSSSAARFLFCFSSTYPAGTDPIEPAGRTEDSCSDAVTVVACKSSLAAFVSASGLAAVIETPVILGEAITAGACVVPIKVFLSLLRVADLRSLTARALMTGDPTSSEASAFGDAFRAVSAVEVD